MTKSDLILAVAEEMDLKPSDARVVVETFLESIAQSLAQSKRVELRGLGTFGVRRRRPRVARNPRTGERVHVPSKRVPYFKAGRILKAQLGLGKTK